MINVNLFLIEILRQAIHMDNKYWIKKLVRFNYKRAHIAIMVEPYLTLLLDGKKTIESRLSEKKMAPFNRVNEGDIVLLKKSGGAIVGIIEVKAVHYFEPKSEDEVLSIKEKYNNRLCGTDEFWNIKKNSRYVTLIEVGELLKLMPILTTSKNRQAWIMGDQLQPNSLLVSISGEIACGKTFISNELSDFLGCKRYSISDYLRYIASEQGICNPSRDELQIIGKEQISLGWDNFVRGFLCFTRWDYRHDLIVDGIRHIEFYEALKKEIYPLTSLVSLYIEADVSSRNVRLSERGEILSTKKHIAEGELSSLKKNASHIINNSIAEGSAAVCKAIIDVFQFKNEKIMDSLFK